MLIHPGCCQQKIRSTARDLKEFLFQLMIVQVSRRFHLFPGDISKGTYHTTSLCFAVQVGLAPWPQDASHQQDESLFKVRGSPTTYTFKLVRRFPSILRTEGGCPTHKYPVPLSPPSFFQTKKTCQGSLYYQPKQCTIRREIPQNYHIFALFDTPGIGNLMTPCAFPATNFVTSPWLIHCSPRQYKLHHQSRLGPGDFCWLDGNPGDDTRTRIPNSLQKERV